MCWIPKLSLQQPVQMKHTLMTLSRESPKNLPTCNRETLTSGSFTACSSLTFTAARRHHLSFCPSFPVIHLEVGTYHLPHLLVKLSLYPHFQVLSHVPQTRQVPLRNEASFPSSFCTGRLSPSSSEEHKTTCTRNKTEVQLYILVVRASPGNGKRKRAAVPSTVQVFFAEE